MIVGGYPIEISQVPWHAQLRRNGQFNCGASIISDQWILTAAHCVSTNANYEIKVGGSHVNNDGTTYTVDQVKSHSNYSRSSVDYDFAVLKLQVKLEFSDNVQPVKLIDVDDIIENGQMSMVTGWGKTQNSSESADLLRAVDVPIVSQEICIDAYSQTTMKITPRMICAGLYGDGGKDCKSM